MEDRFSAVVELEGDAKQAFFAIFDGHGGAKAAEFAAGNLYKNILDEVARRDEEDIKDAVKNGYLNTDAQFLKEDIRGGSCCVTALIRKGNLVVSNAGDCRAVMSRGGVAEALTADHRPSREDEKDRIESMGGYVDLIHGTWRIQGSLAVSRGIGDSHLKQWVIAEPDTNVVRIKPDHEFLILASDGLWDKVGNQEAVDIARRLCIGVEKAEPLSACKKLADLSVLRGSCDDISVMLIQLGRYIAPFNRNQRCFRFFSEPNGFRQLRYNFIGHQERSPIPQINYCSSSRKNKGKWNFTAKGKEELWFNSTASVVRAAAQANQPTNRYASQHEEIESSFYYQECKFPTSLRLELEKLSLFRHSLPGRTESSALTQRHTFDLGAVQRYLE
ncbi:hypothetical protein D5086_018087 [Populus alba]|uniref:Uncharacterized protein n=1 Tax=Populus alba TaxID=43335 RepID=A0ACC4BQ34_POPAL